MKIAKFSIKMLSKEKNKSIFYIVTCTFTVMVSFLFIDMIYNKALQGDIHGKQFNQMLSVMLPVLVIFLIMAVTFYAYNYYLESQTKEMGIYMLGGTKLMKIFEYLLVQNAIIFLVSLIIGIPLGMLVVPLTNFYMSKITGIAIPLFNYSSTAFFGTIGIMVATLIYLAVVSTGFIHRYEIKELIGMRKEMKKKDQRMLQTANILYVLLFCVPVFVVIFNHDPDITVAISVVAILGGFKGFCRYVVPRWIVTIQRKFLITHKLGLISSANFHQLLVQSCSIIQVFLIICIFMNNYMIKNMENRTYLAIVSVSYIMLMISVAMGMGYKILLETNHRQTTFSNLHKLGYTRKELSKIIRQEMLLLFMFVLSILIFYIGGTYIPHVQKGTIHVSFMLWNMSIFVIVLIVVGIYGFKTYNKAMTKGMK